MLPPQAGKPTEIGIRGNHRASVLDRDCGVLGVSNQLSRSSGIPAEPLKNGEVIRAGTNNSGVGPSGQFRHESERFVERRGRAEDARIRRDPNEPRQCQNGQRERFRATSQAAEPLRVTKMFGSRIRAMCAKELVSGSNICGDDALSSSALRLRGSRVRADGRGQSAGAAHHHPR